MTFITLQGRLLPQESAVQRRIVDHFCLDVGVAGHTIIRHGVGAPGNRMTGAAESPDLSMRCDPLQRFTTLGAQLARAEHTIPAGHNKNTDHQRGDELRHQGSRG